MSQKNSITIHSSDSTVSRFETLIPQFQGYHDISDSKLLSKYIKKVERIVRTSFEYRKYINFLKNELDMSRCTFFNEIDIKKVKKVQIEFHHHPFTLYDIVYILINKALRTMDIAEDTFINPLIIADEVCELHFRNEVGLIPLSTTVHELAHNGDIFIPVNLVFGNLKTFVKKYKEFIPEELELKLEIYKDISKANQNIPVLEKNIRYIQIEDRKKLNKILKMEKLKNAA